MNLKVWIRSLQIFNAIPLRFSRRLRNSPRPWVRHAQRPATPDSLKKPHQKAKSSMSLNPYTQIHLLSCSLIHLRSSTLNSFNKVVKIFMNSSGKKRAWIGKIPEKAIRNNAGMVPRENLEESVVRTGRDFPAGGNHCLSKGLTRVHALQLL